MRFITYFMASGLVLTIGVLSYAETPDEMTPAEESVCDELEGAAFGLCNAYCEAMDCDSENPKASETACGKTLSNFMKKTGQLPPCVSADPCDLADDSPANECPCGFFDVPMTEECWIQQDTANVFRPCDSDDCMTEYVEMCSINTRISDGPFQFELVRMSARQLDGVFRCINFVDSPELCMGAQTQDVDNITQEQFISCLCSVQQYADDLEGLAGISIINGDPPFSCFR